MNQNQIQLVQESFEQVKPIANVAADLFYGRLFEIDPSLRPLFKSDLSEQKHSLMTTLAFAV
ncbi:MAG: hemin receptor, partial [Chloroflexota bacterium]